MPEEQETVTGAVASTTEWKSKKGSWVNLDDNPNDFYAYKGKVPKVGQTGTWTVKEGTGFLAEKTELVKLVDGPGLKEKIEAKTKEQVKEMQGLMDKGDNVYFAKQNLIVRQCCVKASAVLVAAAIQGKAKIDKGKVADNTMYIADKLYDWVMERHEQLPEPPEEP